MRTPLAPLALLVLILAGGDAGAPESPEPGLPWLRGFPAAAVVDEPSYRAQVRLAAWQAPDPGCLTSAAGAFEVVADAASAVGAETVLASYTAGVVVLDANGRKIASAPPFACRGSVDEIEYVAVGTPLAGDPVIALAAVAGGRAERTIWLFLFVVRGGGLAPIFTAPVEEWRGSEVSKGEVALRLRGGLEYRAPSGAVTRWAYERDAGRYVMREVLRAPGAVTGPSA
ncbi:MAG TPA: hypothetical protein VN253_29175 [Kofleriaceae bacterium]|nr:hypothetical protein [Kofleriaceae bacterium]